MISCSVWEIKKLPTESYTLTNFHFVNPSITEIPDIPQNKDAVEWFKANGFQMKSNTVMTQKKEGTKELAETLVGKMKVDKEKSGVVKNVITGAGYSMITEAAEIEKEKKGDSFDARQGIYYKNAAGEELATDRETKVIWKAAVKGENDRSASLVSALGAIAFGIATLAF